MDVAGTTAAGVAQSRTTTVGFNDLRSEDFFALMIAQLQAQNPLEPQDNQQLMQQISSIRDIEQSTRLGSALDTQVKALERQTALLQKLSAQRFGDPAALMGMYAYGKGVNASGAPVLGPDGKQVKAEGIVIGVKYNNQGEAILQLHSGSSIKASEVEEVNLVLSNEQPGGGDGDEGDGTADPSDADTDTDPVADGGTDTGATARIRNAAVARQKALAAASHARVDALGSMLDSLFSPGVGIQFGH